MLIKIRPFTSYVFKLEEFLVESNEEKYFSVYSRQNHVTTISKISIDQYILLVIKRITRKQEPKKTFIH